MIGWPIPNSSTPTECPECGVLFERNSLLQLEARHMLLMAGEGACRDLVNQALESAHEDHLTLFRWN